MTSLTANAQTTPLLRVEDLYAAYVKKEILRGVSLIVGRGEIVALLGGNGSGKSTLLKSIAGLLQPTKGRIEFKGRDITSLSVRDRQQGGIGYLIQGGRVFPNLSVQENFEIAMKHDRNGHKAAGAKLGSIFPSLKEKTNLRAGLLSGGQRQMLAIEMVLSQRPELILLDEPTGSLSPNTVGIILKAIASFNRDFGCSTLLVEQNMVEAERIANRQLRLLDGIVILEP
jgi:branched-chain amino acid transport system ATP-binding protein